MDIPRTPASVFLVAVALALTACASGSATSAASSGAGSSGMTSSAPSPTATKTPSPSAPAGPTRAGLDGTWCRADKTGTCMTIQNGALSDGSAVSDAGNDEGAPCLTVHMGSDGGFVAYYCPSGMNPAMAVKTKTDAGTNFDNTSYDRLFSTQAPPYVQTWYRQADLDAATRG